MNKTRELSKRIINAIENIPNEFRTIDRDRLLNNIRDLYDAVLDMELTEETVSQPVEIDTQTPKPFTVTEQKPTIEAKPETAKEVVSEVKILSSETIQAEMPIENELQLEGNSDEGTLASKLNQKPISDLRSGVPLNEKFGFIQNLFQNNASDYGDAVMKMNNSEEQEEALAYFDKLADRKNWDVENPQVKKLRSYIERRHLIISEANTD